MKIDSWSTVEWFLLIILCTIKCNGSAFVGRKEIQGSPKNFGITVNIGIVDVSSTEFNRNVGEHNQGFPGANTAQRFLEQVNARPQHNLGYQSEVIPQNQGVPGNFNSFNQNGHGQSPSHNFNGKIGEPSHQTDGYSQLGQPSYNTQAHQHQQQQPHEMHFNNDDRVTSVPFQRPQNKYNTDVNQSMTRPKETYPNNAGQFSSGQKDYDVSNGGLIQNNYPSNVAPLAYDNSNRATGQNTGTFNTQDHKPQISNHFDSNNNDQLSRLPVSSTTTLYNDRGSVGHVANQNRRPVSGVDNSNRGSGQSNYHTHVDSASAGHDTFNRPVGQHTGNLNSQEHRTQINNQFNGNSYGDQLGGSSIGSATIHNDRNPVRNEGSQNTRPVFGSDNSNRGSSQSDYYDNTPSASIGQDGFNRVTGQNSQGNRGQVASQFDGNSYDGSLSRLPTDVMTMHNDRNPVGNDGNLNRRPVSGIDNNNRGSSQGSYHVNVAPTSTGHGTSNTAKEHDTGSLSSQGHGAQMSHQSVGNEDNQKRRPVSSLGEIPKRGSNGQSSFVNTAGGRPLTSASSRYPSTTDNYYDTRTSTARPTQRTTTSATRKPSNAGCYLPEQPRGGRYELGNCDTPCDKEPGDLVPNTSVLTYTCNEGFVRNGSAVSVCLNNTWYMPPSCLRTCPPLKSISVNIICKHHGNTVPCDEPMEPGTRASLACKPSYKIPLTEDPAYRELTCMKDGLWDRRLFRCLPKCGTTIAHGNTLVVNGFTAKVGVFPWHVGIYEKKSRRVYEQICAGTLINSNLVISAAHCFYDEASNKVKDAANYYVAAGKHYRSWNTDEDYAQKSQIESITVPDRYIGARGNFAQDIVLLNLKTPFELTGLVRPVCLDWDNVLEREHLQVGHYGKAVGWGKTANGQPSEELQEINVPFISFDQCLSDVPSDFRGYITPDKFCAGYLNGSSLCEGDSGGGLSFESNGLWYLRGIISVSPVRDYSCDYNSYTGFTYFSHFREWVRNAFLKS